MLTETFLIDSTLLHAFLTFGRISKHFHQTNCSPGPVDLAPPRWPNSQGQCIYTATEPQRA